MIFGKFGYIECYLYEKRVKKIVFIKFICFIKRRGMDFFIGFSGVVGNKFGRNENNFIFLCCRMYRVCVKI